MANTDKRYQKSTTPILDDEDNHSSHHLVQALWLQRQPDWKEGERWDDLADDARLFHRRFYKERREEGEIRTTAKWDARPPEEHKIDVGMLNYLAKNINEAQEKYYELLQRVPEVVKVAYVNDIEPW